MRKILLIALSIALLLPISGALADSQYTASAGGRELFTVSYSDAYTIDTETFSEDSQGDYIWFMVLFSDDHAIDCGAYVYSDDSALNLYSFTDAELQDYIRSLEGDAADGGYVYVETYQAEAGGKNVPFVICSQSVPDYGDSYSAYTLLGGYEIYFEAYAADGINTDEILNALKNALSTFIPLC